MFFMTGRSFRSLLECYTNRRPLTVSFNNNVRHGSYTAQGLFTDFLEGQKTHQRCSITTRLIMFFYNERTLPGYFIIFTRPFADVPLSEDICRSSFAIRRPFYSSFIARRSFTGLPEGQNIIYRCSISKRLFMGLLQVEDLPNLLYLQKTFDALLKPDSLQFFHNQMTFFRFF